MFVNHGSAPGNLKIKEEWKKISATFLEVRIFVFDFLFIFIFSIQSIQYTVACTNSFYLFLTDIPYATDSNCRQLATVCEHHEFHFRRPTEEYLPLASKMMLSVSFNNGNILCYITTA